MHLLYSIPNSNPLSIQCGATLFSCFVRSLVLFGCRVASALFYIGVTYTKMGVLSHLLNTYQVSEYITIHDFCKAQIKSTANNTGKTTKPQD